MKASRIWEKVAVRLTGLLLGGIMAQALSAWAVPEETFDVLQIGTISYRNVTVTTKSRDYIFILHAAGMTNVKVADLPPDVRHKLGYPDPQEPKVQTNSPAVWAKQTLAKIESPQLKQAQADLLATLGPDPEARVREFVGSLSPTILLIALGGLPVGHLFTSFCCRLICLKTGGKPGLLVWIPVFQMIPMLRAAGMSGWWFLACLVPVLQLVPLIIWPFKIAEARGKNLLIALFLFVPVLNLLAFLYLAFSDGGKIRPQERRISIMTLETA